MNAMRPIVEFKNVCTSYNGKLVLKGVSFKIFRGDRVGLIGNNGAGKTTIIHLVCNLHPYTKGLYLYDGEKVDSEFVSYKSNLGIVLSKPFYVEEFTIQEYLIFVGQMFEIPKDLLEERFIIWTENFGLNELIDTRISKLSSGERMKVSIIASVIHNPDFLIYDEPFTYLDYNSTEILKTSILELENKTVLISSNNLSECFDICNKFLVVENKKIKYIFDKTKNGEDNIRKRIETILTNTD